ncbi:MAG: hypothetical protein ACKVS8_02525 [Phycisphaerales bacterium]
MTVPLAALAMPAVMDRVPTDAMVSIAIPNFEKLQKDVAGIATLVGAPPQAVDSLMLMTGIEKGLKKDGAVALVVMAIDPKTHGAADAPMYVLVPTTDYAALVGNFGVAPAGGDKLDSLMIQNEEVFAKNLGDGYAALAPSKAVLEKVSGKGGNIAAHKTLAGPVGDGLADRSGLSIIVNMALVRPLLEEGIQKQLEDMEGMMPPGPAGANLEAMQALSKEFIEQSRCAVFGTTIDGLGIGLDMTLAFNDGSKLALACAKGGAATPLISKLPAMPYLAVLAMDLSNPAIRDAAKDIAKVQPQQEGAAGIMAKLGNEANDKIDGHATIVGVSPAGLMGGILTNSAGYTATKDAAAVALQPKATLDALTAEKLATGKFEEADIGGTKVNSYEMRLAADPGNPMAAQGMMMMFGPVGGPNGYLAAVDGGVVQTYSKNQALMASALGAAKGEGTLAGDKLIQQVGEKLPPNRVAEVYLGSKGILDTVMPMMAMFMGVQVAVDVPPSLPPIGLALAPKEGTLQASIYVPSPVIKTFAEVAKQVQGPGGEGVDKPGTPKKGAGQPKF